MKEGGNKATTLKCPCVQICCGASYLSHWEYISEIGTINNSGDEINSPVFFDISTAG